MGSRSPAGRPAGDRGALRVSIDHAWAASLRAFLPLQGLTASADPPCASAALVEFGTLAPIAASLESCCKNLQSSGRSSYCFEAPNSQSRESERSVHQQADMAKRQPERGSGRSLGRNANAARMPITGATFIPNRDETVIKLSAFQSLSSNCVRKRQLATVFESLSANVNLRRRRILL